MIKLRFMLIGVALLAASACSPLRSGYSVSGLVSDTSNAPVAGVLVTIVGTGVDPVLTGADGRYVIPLAPCGSWRVSAVKAGYVFVPKKANAGDDGAVLNLGASDEPSLDFTAIEAGAVTIPLIQGRGFTSPLEGQHVSNVIGVVTMVTRKAASYKYETTEYDGSVNPQWVSEDGFFMEAFDGYKDGDPLSSDGIFVYTHNDAYTESAWLDSVPSDLKPGDVVSVSGLVAEYRPMDRFMNNEGYLSVTRIEAPVVARVTAGGSPVTRLTKFPAGVLLTYDDAPTLPVGVTEYRVMPWEESGSLALRAAALVQESVEGMAVRVDAPLVTGSTYYNVTGILADGGKKDGAWNKDVNQQWRGIVLQDPAAAGMDFNTELLFCDYQRPTWTTFNPMPQVGDSILDSDNQPVFRGVMDYTSDGIYMMRPFQFDAEPVDASGATVPSQGWDYSQASNYAWTTAEPDMHSTSVLTSSNVKRTGTIGNWRIGTGADAQFVAPWTGAVEADHLKIAAFNIENFEAQGTAYASDYEIASVFVNNLRLPDVITVVEMGDDRASTIIYENQDNAYSINDGVVTAVENFKAIIDAISDLSGGVQYDFRCIDPEENADGGEPGTNIRVGFLFRTDTVEFVDRGLVTNHLANTAGSADTWPVQFPSPLATTLATTGASVVVDKVTGRPALSQSPGRLVDSPFRGSRKPLAGEFRHIASGRSFFVIGAHLGSKRGDTPLYGEQQPPVFGSDARRAQQGSAIAKLVSQILAVDSQARVAVCGDMNDFPWSDTLKAMTGQSKGARYLYSPSAEFMPANEQFSYSFRGNFQQIDHILVSPQFYRDIAAQATATTTAWKQYAFIAHIDSPFSKNNHVQTSDHDALAVRLYIGD